MLLFLNIYHFHMNVFHFRACMFFQCFFLNYILHFFCIICYGFCSNKCYKKQKTKLSGHVADRTLPSALQTQPDGGEYPAASSSNRWIRAHRHRVSTSKIDAQMVPSSQPAAESREASFQTWQLKLDHHNFPLREKEAVSLLSNNVIQTHSKQTT